MSKINFRQNLQNLFQLLLNHQPIRRNLDFQSHHRIHLEMGNSTWHWCYLLHHRFNQIKKRFTTLTKNATRRFLFVLFLKIIIEKLNFFVQFWRNFMIF